MNNFGDIFCKGLLRNTLFRVSFVLGENLIDGRFIKYSIDLDEIFNSLVSLIEPKLVKIKDRSKITRAVIGAG